MATKSKRETTLTVPAELVRKCHGLALDFGGSVLKVVYRSSDNAEEVKSNDAHFGHLQLAYFPRSEFSDGLDYIQKHARLTATEDGRPPSVLATGLGCTQFGKVITKKLNVKLHNVDEFACFVKAFVYLAANLSRNQLFEPYETDAGYEKLPAILEQMAIMQKRVVNSGVAAYEPDENSGETLCLTALGRVINDSSMPIADCEKDLYPCMLIMCGSGYGFMMINADGTHVFEGGSNRGGRTFLGLGCLLTGCTTYEELLELASKGNERNVDMYSDELFTKDNAVDEDETMYAQWARTKNPVLIYSFGKCPGAKLDDFKREDLAAAVLKYSVQDLVQTAFLSCTSVGVSRVVFCGSLMNSPLLRQAVTSECAACNLFAIVMRKSAINFDFIRPGGHLGAIGALISQLEDSVNTTRPTAP